MHDKDPRGDERDTIAAASRGDAAALQRLAGRLYPRIRTTVGYLVGGSTADLDDMVQLSMLQVLGSLSSFRGDSSVHRWADRITVRTTIRALKKRRRRAAVVHLDPEIARFRRDTAGDVLGKAEMRQRLASLLLRIPEKRRTPLVMRLVHGYTVEEIAEATQSTPNTVRDRLQTGRKELRKLMLKDPAVRTWHELNR